jgi:hypothetical protein
MEQSALHLQHAAKSPAHLHYKLAGQKGSEPVMWLGSHSIVEIRTRSVHCFAASAHIQCRRVARARCR